MRGQLLAVDQEGTGYITGDDGARYRFDMKEWKSQHAPTPGQALDFEAVNGEARAIFAMKPGAVPAKAGNARAASVGEKSNIAAGLLALFLGGLGIHKFYIGKSGAGITMLLISLFGFILLFVPTIVIGIIAFIEGIIYLVTPQDEFTARYVEGDKSWF